MVLGGGGRILHANRAARRFTGPAVNDPHGAVEESIPFRIPPPLQEFSERVAVQLETRIAADDLAQFEMKRIARLGGREFLLRGFGIPDRFLRQQSRIVLILQPLSPDYS
jgi:hypothetical protein